MNRELLAEVLAHPDDDTPRRILADWLTDHDDPRGELIAVQCELARRDAKDPARRELEMRELDLLREHGPRWVTELGLPDSITATRVHKPVEHARGAMLMFHRGFPDQLKVDCFALADATLEQIPLRRLVLTDATDADIEVIARLPRIPGLVTLRLRDAFFSADAVAKLSDLAVVSTIEELSFHRCTMTDAIGFALADFPQLRSLQLEDFRFEHVQTLAQARWLPALQTLRIKDSRHHLLRELLLSKSWRDLTRLELETYLDDGDVAAIASAQIALNLEHLEIDLGYRDIGATIVEAFSRSKRLRKLRTLVLSGRSRETDLAPLEKRWGAKLVVRS